MEGLLLGATLIGLLALLVFRIAQKTLKKPSKNEGSCSGCQCAGGGGCSSAHKIKEVGKC